MNTIIFATNMAFSLLLLCAGILTVLEGSIGLITGPVITTIGIALLIMEWFATIRKHYLGLRCFGVIAVILSGLILPFWLLEGDYLSQSGLFIGAILLYLFIAGCYRIWLSEKWSHKNL